MPSQPELQLRSELWNLLRAGRRLHGEWLQPGTERYRTVARESRNRPAIWELLRKQGAPEHRFRS